MQSFSRWYQLLLRNPRYRWWIILGTVVYLFSPLDISPDIIPILGQVDDVVIVTLLFSGLYQIFQDYVRSLTGEAEVDNAGFPKEQGSAGTETDSAVIDVDARTIDDTGVS
ncbi:MAG: YkvA family protein [Microcoleaceae cyanobacterium]